jgi:hypothetical protein
MYGDNKENKECFSSELECRWLQRKLKFYGTSS